MTTDFETKEGPKIVINNENRAGCADQLFKGCGFAVIIVIVLIFIVLVSIR